jgi:adenosylmethionine-8-amino-7-oxononanoate aminotransferase
MTNVPAGLLCEKLAELAPGDLNHVFLSTGDRRRSTPRSG